MTYKEQYEMSYLLCTDKEYEEEVEDKEIQEICDRIEKILKKEVKND